MQSEDINFLEFIKDSSHSDEKKIEIQEKVNKLNAELEHLEKSENHLEIAEISEKKDIYEDNDNRSKNEEDDVERRSINENEIKMEDEAKIINSLVLDGGEILVEEGSK